MRRISQQEDGFILMIIVLLLLVMGLAAIALVRVQHAMR